MPATHEDEMGAERAMCGSPAESRGGAVVRFNEAAEAFAGTDRALELRTEVRIEDTVVNTAPPVRARSQIMRNPTTYDVIHLP